MKKILLGEKQYVGKQNVDNFIEIEIARTIETIKKDSIDNIFDFNEQYVLERNNSLKFCLYGMVESRFGHCDNITINMYIGDLETSGLTKCELYSPTISYGTTGQSLVTLSYPLSDYDSSSILNLSKNIYGATKGSYFFLFELNKQEIITKKKTQAAFISVYDPINELFGELIIPIIYFDPDGEIINYGTENADFSNNNEIIEINNNFPFFYDRHWVKLNLELFGPKTIFFTTDSALVSETSPSAFIDVSLSEESVHGLERAKVIIQFAIDKIGNEITTIELGQDLIFIEPILSWKQGEKIKTFEIKINNDLIVENTIETLVLRIVPISNVKINPSETYKFTLLIESEDTPSIASFINPTFEFLKPNPLQMLYKSNVITINLSKPIDTNDQNIEVSIVKEKTTAIQNVDYFLDQQDTIFVINAPIGSTSVQFNINIPATIMYEVEKKIVFELKQKTSNITIAGNTFQTEITIKDGMLYKYVQHVIPVDKDKGYGIFKTIFNSANPTSTSLTIMKEAQPDPSISCLIPQPCLTNVFNCKFRIKNIGEQIVWNNQIIETNGSFDILLDFATITSDILIDLPTNYVKDINNKSYVYTNYNISIVDISKFIPTDTPNEWKELIDALNTFNTNIGTSITMGNETKGSVRRFLITELNQVYSQLNNDNNSCSLFPDQLNKIIRFNGGVLLPNETLAFFHGSESMLFFNENKIKNICGKSNLSLPVGLDYIPAGPYNIKYVELNLGGVFIQDGFQKSSSSFALRLGTLITPGGNSSYSYFRNWNAIDIGAKTNLKLKITNNGDNDVEILGKVITISQSEIYDLNNINFENISIILPTNDDYSAIDNGFRFANYKIQILDADIYNGNTYSLKTIQKTLPNFVALGDSIQNMPTYYLLTKYNYILLPANSNGNLDCSQNILTCPFTVQSSIYVNDLLFFGNTGTLEGESVYSTNLISPTCPTSFIKYQTTN